jgi:hypothetical protein
MGVGEVWHSGHQGVTWALGAAVDMVCIGVSCL